MIQGIIMFVLGMLALALAIIIYKGMKANQDYMRGLNEIDEEANNARG